MFGKTSLALVYEYFQRMTRMHSAVFAMARCLSIRLSVTSRYCIETAKIIITQQTPYDGPGLSISVAKDLDDIPAGSQNASGGKLTIFDQYLALSRKR